MNVPDGATRVRSFAVAFLLIAVSTVMVPARSVQIYECTGSEGEVVYQDQPCAEEDERDHESAEVHTSVPAPAPLDSGHPAVPWVSLPFEESLNNSGHVLLEPSMVGASAQYESAGGRTALHTQGTDGWLEYHVRDQFRINRPSGISFEFKADRWINSEANGGIAQTICSLTHVRRRELFHISFGFYSWQHRSPYVHFRAKDGSYHKIVARNERVDARWHTVGLVVEPEAGLTTFYFDGVAIESVSAVPALASVNVEKIVLGTWRREAQAYRGLIDNLTIAPL